MVHLTIQLMNWSNNIKKTSFLFFVFMFMRALVGFGQNADVHIIKKTCSYFNKYSGEKLIIHYKKDTFNLTSSINYSLFDFIKLPDSGKFLIIEKLLDYENDTSLCCMDVANWSFNGIEGCRGKPKGIKRYTIQVDALFMINRLCWPKLMELYSCSQVLYDSKLKKSINTDPKKIKIVFAAYKKWYEECKAKGEIVKYFPLNNGRYVWYGGRKSMAPKE